MNYLQYYPLDVVNGEGTRCTLFVSGCTHKCRGCYNQKSWSFTSGTVFDELMEQQIINDLNDQRIKRQGLSLSGGDPFHPQNIPTLLKLVKRIKQECQNKDIWAWTGYQLQNFTPLQLTLLTYVDVLIDGKFEQHLYDPSLIWRGSSNQRVYRFDHDDLKPIIPLLLDQS